MKLMIEYDRGDNLRIHHLLKVHNLAVTIGQLEGVDQSTMDIIEAAAIVHDIGIHSQEQKNGSAESCLQDTERAAEARMLLKRAGGFSDNEIERVAWLTGNSHDHSAIDNIDSQILAEADFLVRINENNISSDTITEIGHTIFKTKTGRELMDAMYGGSPWSAAPQDKRCQSCC